MPSDEVSEPKLWAPPLPTAVQRIGRYSVVKTLGAGGMANIYLARATGKGGFEKWVAIKRAHAHLANRPNIVTMILNEARLVARFDHENICPILDVDADDYGPYIVMPYMHGESLAELIRTFHKKAVPVPFEQVAHAGACVADGLHYAHNALSDEGTPLNVIHRDISPQNIFLTFQGSVKVLDFGVAKAIGFESATAVGAIKGKYAYMSPEQVQGEVVDRRSDIFSLGVVLWETLACRRLFKRDNELLTADAVVSHRAPLLTSVAPHVPERLAKVVDRALEPDRRNRYQTALELSQSLRTFLAERRTFIGSLEMQSFMKATFPGRGDARDPAWNSTELDQPLLRRTATDVAFDVLIAFDEVSKPDETVRVAPLSRGSEDAPTPAEGIQTMPDQHIDDVYRASDSQETTIPPFLRPRPRSMSEETLRPPSDSLEYLEYLEEQEVLEENTLDPTGASTEDSPALDPELAQTLQLPTLSREVFRSESSPLVLPVWSTLSTAEEKPTKAHPSDSGTQDERSSVSTTAKVPRQRHQHPSGDHRLAQSVLGIAFILLALSIVLWARQCLVPG
jgi:eukaryotic-like serine/threonine-protein kinase